MGDYRYNPVDLTHNAHLLAGESSVFDKIGIGVADADQALEISGIVHISAEQGTTPDAPANGDGGLLYTKADGKPYWRSNDVSETDLSAAGGGGGSGDITRVNITAGTGLTGTQNTASGDHTQTLALSHLGIQSLSDPNADRIMFWDDTAGVMAFLVPNDNLAISGTNLNATDTNTTYSAGNGCALGGTTFTVAGGSGLVQESGGLALDDPINLSQLTESTDATDDKILLWDESGNAWKYMTLDDLQDSIDTGGGGVSLSGTTNNTVATVTGSNALIGEANLTFDGNSMLIVTGAAGSVPLTVKGHASQTADIVKFQKGTSEVAVIDSIGQLAIFEAGSANPAYPLHIEWQNSGQLALFKRTVDDPAGNAYITVDNTANASTDAQLRLTAANDGASKVFFGDAADFDVGRIVYDHGDNSMDFYTNAAKAFVIRHDKIVDFKIAAHEDGSMSIAPATDSASGMNPMFLEVKVAGTQYYLRLWE
jgi:hypothetical protein